MNIQCLPRSSSIYRGAKRTTSLSRKNMLMTDSPSMFCYLNISTINIPTLGSVPIAISNGSMQSLSPTIIWISFMQTIFRWNSCITSSSLPSGKYSFNFLYCFSLFLLKWAISFLTHFKSKLRWAGILFPTISFLTFTGGVAMMICLVSLHGRGLVKVRCLNLLLEKTFYANSTPIYTSRKLETVLLFCYGRVYFFGNKQFH